MNIRHVAAAWGKRSSWDVAYRGRGEMLGFTGKITLDLCFTESERVWCIELMSPTSVCVIHTAARPLCNYIWLISRRRGSWKLHFQKEGDLRTYTAYLLRSSLWSRSDNTLSFGGCRCGVKLHIRVFCLERWITKPATGTPLPSPKHLVLQSCPFSVKVISSRYVPVGKDDLGTGKGYLIANICHSKVFLVPWSGPFLWKMEEDSPGVPSLPLFRIQRQQLSLRSLLGQRAHWRPSRSFAST